MEEEKLKKKKDMNKSSGLWTSGLPLPGDTDEDLQFKNNKDQPKIRENRVLDSDLHANASAESKGCYEVTKRSAYTGYTMGGLFSGCLGVARYFRFRREGMPVSVVHHIGIPSLKGAVSFGVFLAGMISLVFGLQ